jgi:hypothetical protein
MGDRTGWEMPAKANIAKHYRIRLGVIGLMCLAFAGWFAYDAMIGYPAENAMAAQYAELRNSGDTEAFEAFCKEHDYDPEPGGGPEVHEVEAQYAIAALCTPLALFFLYHWLVAAGKSMWTTQDAIETSWGQAVPFDKVKTLDKKRWDKKGIAVVHYEQANGEKGKLVIDDWKYDRPPTDTMLRELESHLKAEQFVNGGPEPDEPETPGDEGESGGSDEFADDPPGDESDAAHTDP